jgi:hypothetical protein
MLLSIFLHFFLLEEGLIFCGLEGFSFFDEWMDMFGDAVYCCSSSP